MSERGISRRQFLKLGAGITALFALRGFVGIELDARAIERQANMQRSSDELLERYPFLTPYASFHGEIPTMAGGVTTMVAVQPRPAAYSLAGMRICDGTVPGISVTTSFGTNVAYNGGYAYENIAESDALIGGRSLSELTVPLIQGPPAMYRDRPVSTIVIAGDSWTRWGGVEHSYASMLQRLFSYSGLGVAIHDISVSGVNIANHMLVMDKLKNQNLAAPPDLIISTLHNTDFVQDTQRVHSPIEYQEGLMNDDAVYQTATDFDARTAAIRRFIGGVEHYLPGIRYLRSQFRSRKGGDMRVLTNPEGTISEAGYLASLTDAGRPYFDEYKYLVGSFIGHNRSSDHIMLTLPNGLTDGVYDVFRTQVIGPVEAVASNQGARFESVNTHDYPTDQFDAFSHPTPQGSYYLAEKTFKTITGANPPEEAVKQTWDHANRVKEIADVFRSNL